MVIRLFDFRLFVSIINTMVGIIAAIVGCRMHYTKGAQNNNNIIKIESKSFSIFI